MNNKKGLTLIETIIALSVTGAITVGVINDNIEETRSELMSETLKEAAKVIYAVDHRIAIDGYDPTRWNAVSWNNKDKVIDDLIAKELTSSKLTECSGGRWNPRLPLGDNARLIDCKMWSNDKENDFDYSAEFILDDFGYIRDFDLFISFKNKEMLTENIIEIKRTLLEIESDNSKESSGIHNFDFVNNKTNEEILTSECVSDFKDCSLRMSMNRSGSYEYLTLYGDQSMLDDSQLTFIESKKDGKKEPLKCIHWKNNEINKTDDTSHWFSKEEDCGIGVYTNNQAEDSKAIAVVANVGSFENIVLDKECSKLNWTAGDIVDGSNSPCGVLSDGSVVQIVDNAIATTGLFENSFIKDAYFKDVEVDNINNVKYANIKDKVEVSNKATVKEVIVDSLLDVKGDFYSNNSTFNSIVEIENAKFNENINFNTGSEINVDGNLTINKSISIKENLDIENGSLIVKNNVRSNDLNTKDFNSTNHIKGLTINKLNTAVNINNSGEMTAPIGNFVNYTTDFNNIRTKIDNFNSLGSGSITPNDIYTNVPGSWTNSGSVTSCDAWTPDPSTTTKGESFEQTRFCVQKQEQFTYHYKNNVHISTTKKTKNITISQTRNAIGTKEEFECINIHSANIAVGNTNKSYIYNDYSGYTLRWKNSQVAANIRHSRGIFNDWTLVNGYYYKKYGNQYGFSSGGGHGGYTLNGICRSPINLSSGSGGNHGSGGCGNGCGNGG